MLPVLYVVEVEMEVMDQIVMNLRVEMVETETQL